MNQSDILIENYNNDFLIIKSKSDGQLQLLGATLHAAQLPFIEELIVTPAEICLKLNSLFSPECIERLKQLQASAFVAPDSLKLPICFSEHDDWSYILAKTGLRKQEIRERLLSTQFKVAMFGFLPGFTYMTGLEPLLHVPRKPFPSKYVPANSLAIGGQYLGVYAVDSPGGWHVIARVAVSLLQTHELPPVEFRVGDEVGLQELEEQEFENIKQRGLTLKQYNAVS